MFIKMKESKGFTLVELMIVVAIIGILAAVAVPYYQKYIQKSRLTSKVFPGIHTIETNLATYYSFNQAFPGQATLDILASDANTQYFGATIAGNVVTFTIHSAGPTSPLHSLDTQVLTVQPITAGGATGGKIIGWQLGGTLATNLGLGSER